MMKHRKKRVNESKQLERKRKRHDEEAAAGNAKPSKKTQASHAHQGCSSRASHAHTVKLSKMKKTLLFSSEQIRINKIVTFD